MATKRRNNAFKKGQEVVMLFHCAGLVSEEKFAVLVAHKDGTITLDTDCERSKCYRFDTKTGKCLNDNTFMGAYRTLKGKYESRPIAEEPCPHTNRVIHNGCDEDGDEWEECFDCGEKW